MRDCLSSRNPFSNQVNSLMEDEKWEYTITANVVIPSQIRSIHSRAGEKSRECDRIGRNPFSNQVNSLEAVCN